MEVALQALIGDELDARRGVAVLWVRVGASSGALPDTDQECFKVIVCLQVFRRGGV